MNSRNVKPKKETTKKIIIKSLVGLSVSLITFPIFAIIGSAHVGGRIFGFAFYLILLAFCTYEFANIMPLPKWAKYYLPLIVFLFFFFSFSETTKWFNASDQSSYEKYIVQQYIFKVGFDGAGYLITFLIVIVPFFFLKWNKRTILNFFILYLTILIMGITSKNLFYLNSGNFWFTVVIYTSVIATDTFAYFGGKFLGNKFFKRKLAPKISPNKSIEGAIVGYLFGFIIIFFSLFFGRSFLPQHLSNLWYVKLIISLTLPIVAICGDLLFSAVKRIAHVKDFSDLIPEHGGLLDRLDSLIVVSFFYLMIFI